MSVNEDLIEFGTTHIKLFDAQKKEYKKLRTYWAGIKEHVSSFDELDMATTRLRVRLPDEPKPDTPQMNILEPSELAHHKLKLASDKIIAEAELRKKLGQLLYLKNLEKSQMEGPGGVNPEPCPICQQELGKEWSVMQCGHCFCIECIRIVVDRYSFGGRRRTVKCAVCRQTSLHGEISYVTTSQGHSIDSEMALRVKGSHSTKVEAVVRCLLKIKHDDPTAKALVFSTWVDVLSVIATALSENGLEHRALYTPGKFQAQLSSFKQDEDVTALLLPVHSGANGLNLIEATYVILVEPVLNPAQELQAIGRVHRIGQTKPTKVHRFLIKHTIEQKMQTLLGTMDVKATTKNAEENALTIADLASLFTQQLETEEADHLEVPGPSIEAIRNGSAEGGPESLTQQVETEENDSCEVPGLSVETLRNDSTEESESLAQQVETEEIDTHEIPGPSTEAMALRNDSVDEKTVNQTAVEAKEIVETERTGTHEVPEPSTEALMNNNAEEEMANQGGIEIEDIVANVEISNDNHEEADDNDEKVCIGSASNVIEVNSDDDVEITGEEGESERDSEENEERESDEEECNGWDSWGMWDSYSDYYGSDKEFDGDENSENEHEDDDDVNDDVSGAAKDGENDRHADDNSGTYGLDSGDTEVDPQLAVEVDDVIAMDSVDLMAANIEDNNDVIAMDSVDLMAANIENNNDVIVVEDDQIDQR